jgi:hypothetical protein
MYVWAIFTDMLVETELKKENLGSEKQ